MNLAIRGIDADIQWNNEGSFLNDAHKDLRANFVMANPPFNDSDWKGELLRDDARWKYGTPPTGNANFAWVQHFIYHLAPNGIAGFVLANGSMSSNTAGEGEIRKNIIEADLIDCMISLPTQLFYNVGIPACLWFIARDKKNHKYRDRRGEVLLIDGRKMGVLVDRRHRDLTDEEIQKIASTYHAWRGEGGKYEDIKGFCKSATLDEIKQHGYILTPGRYVGTEDVEEDEQVFEEKMKILTASLAEQIKQGQTLNEEIKRNLGSIGFKL
jgi:type I restriction enzyme M protein